MQRPTDMNAGPQILDRAAIRLKAPPASPIRWRRISPSAFGLPLSCEPIHPTFLETASNLVCMISDVVTAAQGNPADELRAGMSAHFSSAAQALKAAKSIERSIIGVLQAPSQRFVRRRRRCPPSHRASAFLEGDPGPVSPAHSLLRQAQPGQIFVSQETYEHLRDLPGLQFRALNADAATGGDNELLWTSTETMPISQRNCRMRFEGSP